MHGFVFCSHFEKFFKKSSWENCFAKILEVPEKKNYRFRNFAYLR